jgi:hypothetical protein
VNGEDEGKKRQQDEFAGSGEKHREMLNDRD